MRACVEVPRYLYTYYIIYLYILEKQCSLVCDYIKYVRIRYYSISCTNWTMYSVRKVSFG